MEGTFDGHILPTTCAISTSSRSHVKYLPPLSGPYHLQRNQHFKLKIRFSRWSFRLKQLRSNGQNLLYVYSATCGMEVDQEARCLRGNVHFLHVACSRHALRTSFTTNTYISYVYVTRYITQEATHEIIATEGRCFCYTVRYTAAKSTQK